MFAKDGNTKLGAVKRVLAVPEDDIFDGLILDTPDGDRFVDAEGVRDLHEHGVVLDLDNADDLHAPTDSPAAMAASPDDTVSSPVRDRLRRAWDMVSGNY